MPAQRKIKTAEIKIVTTQKIKDFLEQLTQTGLYGKSHTETAERLLARAIEDLVREGRLKEK